MSKKTKCALCVIALLALQDSHSQEANEPALSDADAASTVETYDTIPIDVAGTEAPPPAAAEEPSRQLEEIVVTATKREESVRDIPASINVLTGDALEASGVQSVEQMVTQTPGVNFFGDGQRAPHVTIRGISSGVDQNQTTGSIFGNVSLNDPYLQLVSLDPNPFDLQRVEILKGPQGTLFGAGGFNGAVRYVPEPPTFGEWQVKTFAQYTSVEQGDAEPIFGAAVNVPIGSADEWALRVVGLTRREPGFIDDTRSGRNDINSLKQTAVRGTLGWKPDDPWDIKLGYAFQKTTAPDTAIADNLEGELKRNTSLTANPTRNRFELANLAIGYDFDGATLASETAVIRKKVFFFQDESRLIDPGGAATGLGFNGLGLRVFNRTKIVTQELRLTSRTDADSPWKWITGVFGMKETYLADIALPFGDPLAPTLPVIPGLPVFTPDGEVNAGTILTQAKVDEIALFGDVTRQLGESWEVSLGGRLYKTRSGGTSTKGGALFAGTSNVDATVRETGFSPKASVTWRISDDVLSYATISRGFRVGGVQPGIVTIAADGEAPTSFQSDTLTNHEAGLRTEWFDKTLLVDAAVFYLDWKDAQIRVTSPSDNLSNYFTNVGGVESKGVEASIQWLPPIDGLLMNTGASYTDTTTTKAFDTGGDAPIPAGSRFPQSPKWQTATTLSYLCACGDWLPGASITHTFLGRAISSLEDQFPINDYEQWDAGLSLANPAISWFPSISFTVTNLLDERGIAYRGGTAEGEAAADYQDIRYIRPRAFTLRLSLDFS